MWKASLNKRMNFDIADLFETRGAEEESNPTVESSPELIRPRTSVVIEEISDEDEIEILGRRKRLRIDSSEAGPSSSRLSPDLLPETSEEGHMPVTEASQDEGLIFSADINVEVAEVGPEVAEAGPEVAEASMGNVGIGVETSGPGSQVPVPPRSPQLSLPRESLKRFVTGEAEAKAMSLPQLSDFLNLATSNVTCQYSAFSLLFSLILNLLVLTDVCISEGDDPSSSFTRGYFQRDAGSGNGICLRAESEGDRDERSSI